MAFHVKTFFTRAATALVFAAVLLSCVWYSYYSFVTFFAIVGLIGLNEFYKIAEKLNINPNRIIGYFAYISIIAFLYTLVEAPIIALPVGFTLIILFSFILFLFEL